MNSRSRYLPSASVLVLVVLLAACVPPSVPPPQAAQLGAASSSPAAVDTITVTPSMTPPPTKPAIQMAAGTTVPVNTPKSPTSTQPSFSSSVAPAPMPDLTFATIITDDLPSGFQFYLPWSPGTEGIRSYVVANGFSADRTGYGQGLAGVVVWLPSPEARERFDRSLAQGTWPSYFTPASTGPLSELAGLPRLGDVTAGLTGPAGKDAIAAMMRYDLIIWRRGDVGALVGYAYVKDDEDKLSVGDVARRLDERIAWVLSTDPASRSRLTPTPAPRLMPVPPPARTPVAWSTALTPTLTLADMPVGFRRATKEMGVPELTISPDSPYPAVSAVNFARPIYTLVFGFVVNLSGTEKQARFDAALSHPDRLFEEVTGMPLTVRPSAGPAYADLSGLGDVARQMTMTEQTSFFGPLAIDLVCLRRGSLGGCVVVESIHPKQGPHARALAGLLDDRMRVYEAARP